MTLKQFFWWAISSTAGASKSSGIGLRFTMWWCRNYCAKCAKARASSMFRATMTSSCATFVGETFGDIEIAEEGTHHLVDGRRVLVLHGDKFDTVVRNIKWLAHLGGAPRHLLTRPLHAMLGDATLLASRAACLDLCDDRAERVRR